ncbi:pseudouridine synthase [Maribellus sp. YY47]|uniref:RluA family pseudouridine synthase n=1 Tax=Maribellus sp. YY47 TaxID=2929486 RepID=UPI002000F1FE|nr:pseudouridine synthase [Maribellus sp. YY47]MCK3685300.1 pseudouridine synthase [Maribellus sp. YY47]
MEIPVIFQDEHLIVVNKPVDLPVHKNDFMPHDAAYLTKLIGDMTGKWVYNVHRLDSKTSGVIVLALSKEVAHELAQMFERKEVQKTYYAVVQGEPGEGSFDRKVLVKKKSKFKKPALTHFKTLQTIQTNLFYAEKLDIKLSLVEINPETGRWHQLRQHFAQHHFDMLGDSHHGDFTLNKMVTEKTGVKRLFLHAGKLAFVHPVTKEPLLFEAEIPDVFGQILAELKSVV